MAQPPGTTNVNTNPLAAAQIATFYGPETQLALRRSQYLADALHQLSAEGGQNIRGGFGEVGAKLLATAILQRSNDKSQDTLIKALQADRQQQDTAAMAGTPLADPNFGQTPPAAPAPATPPQQAPPPPPVVASDAPQPPQGPQVSPQDRTALAQMVATEARGEGPVGMAAAAHVALNRLKAGYGGAKSLSDVVYAPHQFEGIAHAGQLGPQDLGPAQQVADAVLAGQVPDPTNGATHFLNPVLQQQLGRAIPQWAQGQGQRIGNHVFFGGTPQQQADAAMAAHQLPPGTLMGGGNPGQPGQDPMRAAGFPQAQAQPYQVASNGPTPPPPQGQGPIPPQGVPPGPQGEPPNAPQLQPTPPSNYVAPNEWALAAHMMANYRTHDQGLAYLEELKKRAAEPVAMKPGTYWDPKTGQAHSVEQFVDQPGAPNATTQRSSLDNHITSTPNAAYGAVPPGMAMDRSGALSPVPTAPAKSFRIPGALGLYMNDPGTGKPVKVADDAITPKDLQTSRDGWRNSDEVKKAFEGIEAYNGLAGAVARMGGNNGVISTAAIDSYLRGINPGMGARNTTVNMFLNHLGLPTELQAWVQNNVPGGGGGYLTPATFNQMLSTIRAYAGAHAEVAQGLADRDLKAFQNYGVPVTPDMLGEALTPFAAPPQVKWLNEAGDGGGAPVAAHPDGASPQSAFRPQSNADLDRLPNGAWYINPADNQPYRKRR